MTTGRPLGFTALLVGAMLAGIAYYFWDAPSRSLTSTAAAAAHNNDLTMRYISALFGRGR